MNPNFLFFRTMVSEDHQIPVSTSEAGVLRKPPEPSTIEIASAVCENRSEGLPEGEAAVIVQKVYRSYRTRRQLADCAVMNKDYAWWNVLESVLLQQRSEAFYAYDSPDTSASRWTRLKKKAAKVGKGLSKDENARKLAIQHWLEAIDPRHRYGHNLHYYYVAWENSSTKEPFFYWLDVGEGKDVDLHECKRSKLQKQQIKYLGPQEREEYEVVIEGGKLHYKQSGEFVNTPEGDKWIFVMSASGKLYVAQKQKGTFQHSSFLAGGAAKAAGRLLVNHGTLELMEAHSGHYRPTKENFSCLVQVLEELGTDLSMVKVQSVSDDMLQKYPSGRDAEMTEELKADEFFMEGDTVQDSNYTPEARGGVPETKETNWVQGGSLENQSSVDEQEACTKNVCDSSVNEFQVRVFDRQTSKVRFSVECEEQKMEIVNIEKLTKQGNLEDTKEEVDIAKLVMVPSGKPRGPLKWTTEAGPRIASLADVPSEELSKVF